MELAHETPIQIVILYVSFPSIASLRNDLWILSYVYEYFARTRLKIFLEMIHSSDQLLVWSYSLYLFPLVLCSCQENFSKISWYLVLLKILCMPTLPTKWLHHNILVCLAFGLQALCNRHQWKISFPRQWWQICFFQQVIQSRHQD